MRYRRLGRSALQVSEICLGTMNFGPRTAESDAQEILNHSLDAGINFIDTANQYGGQLGVGATEMILGRWFSEEPSRRDNVVLATKVYEPMGADVNDRGLSARHIQAACDASLKRLCVDHIDLLQMHHIDRYAPTEEIMQAMSVLIAQGKITYVGSSNFPGWAIARYCERARAGQHLGLVSEQAHYNLIERRIELEVLPACREYGLGLVPWSPLAGGVLAGTTGNSGRRSSTTVQEAAASRAEQLGVYGTLCAELGFSPGQVAVAWLLHQPMVSAVLAGPGSLEQLNDALDAPRLTLDAATLERIDQIFPPAGEAPEAFAW